MNASSFSSFADVATVARRFALPAAALVCAACGTETPTEAVVVNEFPVVPDGGAHSGEVTIYKVWYASTLFRDALAPGQTSESERTVPGSATAYAVLAEGWDPSSNTPPSAFVPIQSNVALGVSRGDTLSIDVSDASFTGRCGGSEPLDQSAADFITERIFPAEFAGVRYDAVTCTSVPVAGADAGDATVRDRDGASSVPEGSASERDAARSDAALDADATAMP